MKATIDSWPNKPMPTQYEVITLDGVFSAEDYAVLVNGFVPTNGAKWFIYCADDMLHFHRANTGSCIFQLALQQNEDHVLAPHFIANRNPAEYRTIDTDYDFRLMVYLMDRYLFGRNPTFPQPSRMSAANKAQHQQHVLGNGPTNGTTGSIISIDSI